MKSPVPGILAAALLALLPLGADGAAPLCALPPEFAASNQPTPRVAALLRPGGDLAILALGTASSFGPDGRQPRLGFPARMAAALRKAAPEARITLTLKGGRGLTAAAMLPMLRGALRSSKVGLVIWQTGTVEAVRDSPPGNFLAALAEGLSIVRAAGADLILVDPQFSRFLRTDTNIDAYESAFHEVAFEPGVVLFARYELTHAWVDAGSFDLERARSSATPALAAAMQDCIGQALAHFILSGAEKAGGSSR
ncbi:MAG: hypothetical protein M0002_09830 [Rhodospirillales bacterium]|nr:hypothetical protein [Rhodospirillales bacterium]